MSKFVNFVNKAMVAINKTAEGKEFANVSFECPKSKTGYAAFAVNMGQLLPATRKDGSVVDGYYNILLGKEEGTRKVSIATNKKGTNYKNIEMTNAEIAECFNAARTAYRQAQKAGAEA